MITVDTLRRCAWMNSLTLEQTLRKFYPKDVVLAADFLGISNGGQFVYNIAYPSIDDPSKVARSKVYVWLDNNGELMADY